MCTQEERELCLLMPTVLALQKNSCDQNLNVCLELIEQVAKVQGQLFGILTATAQEGGRNDSLEVIKSRLLPWLEATFTGASLGKPVSSKAPFPQPTRSEQRSWEYRSPEPRRWEQRRSERRGSDKRGSEKPSAEAICNYEKQIRTLKDEIAALCAEKSALQGRSARSRSPSPAPRGRSRSHSRSRSRSRSRTRSPRHSRAGSPSTAMVKIRTPSPSRARLSSAARKAALLSRFNDAYSQARLDAQCLLRRCIDEAETVQRIIYIATVEAFHIAKMAFRHFKTRVKKSLTPSYAGTNDFEDAVLDYILCHLDLYDAQSSVNDVIRAMNINPKISCPQEVDFCILSNFIQEICCIAFAMQTLEPPLDIAFGADGEVFNDSMYRRSYDSDFTAPLVFYHVWPALMENDTVIMKGEAVTKRGAFWNSMRSVSRSRSRSLSPVCLRSHIGLSTVSQSRSPSPVRYGLPRF
nr:PREDICTED: mitochondria-eating protein [Rhinolophus sinicus]